MSTNKFYTELQVNELRRALRDIAQWDEDLEDDWEDAGNRAMDALRCFEKVTPIELPSDSLCINCDESKSTHNVCMDCIIKIGKENIQLPSDEEISEEGQKQWGNVHSVGVVGWLDGVKWLRDKIQGNNS